MMHHVDRGPRWICRQEEAIVIGIQLTAYITRKGPMEILAVIAGNANSRDETVCLSVHADFYLHNDNLAFSSACSTRLSSFYVGYAVFYPMMATETLPKLIKKHIVGFR
jgi:hypothetical protein